MKIASLSLDLDNQWSYMKTHGDAGWESFPTYLDIVIPRFLDLFDEVQVKSTIMIVGQDAALEKNRQALSQIPLRGHEVGNHSFHHEPWLHLYSRQEIESEVSRAEEAIATATGVCPRGWRGPGFSFSPDLLDVLASRDYLYDGSTFPTYLGPLARAYYFMTSGLSREEKKKRKQLFGKFSEGMRPLKPYFWQPPSGSLLEIPVTTFPLIKTPFHVSYLLYLATFSKLAAKLYFGAALHSCRMAGIAPSLLLHPLDFLGADDCPQLAFFPAMNKGGQWKCELVTQFLNRFQKCYQVGTMADHAAAISKARLPTRTLAPVHG